MPETEPDRADVPADVPDELIANRNELAYVEAADSLAEQIDGDVWGLTFNGQPDPAELSDGDLVLFRHWLETELVVLNERMARVGQCYTEIKAVRFRLGEVEDMLAGGLPADE